jgi:hypothetical protein
MQLQTKEPAVYFNERQCCCMFALAVFCSPELAVMLWSSVTRTECCIARFEVFIVVLLTIQAFWGCYSVSTGKYLPTVFRNVVPRIRFVYFLFRFNKWLYCWSCEHGNELNIKIRPSAAVQSSEFYRLLESLWYAEAWFRIFNQA